MAGMESTGRASYRVAIDCIARMSLVARTARTARLARTGLLCGVLTLGGGSAVSRNQTGADAADPPRSVRLDTSKPAAQWLPQILPAGARLVLGPVALPFGAHATGQLLAWRTSEGGYAVVYLTPDAQADAGAGTGTATDTTRQQRWFWLREPRDADFGLDIEVRAVFAAGPALSRDIVLLESYSRPAPAGGGREFAGSVYRRIGEAVEAVPALSALLHGAPDAATARARLAPAYSRLLPTVPGRLAGLFASLPWPQVELTAQERLQRLQPAHPAFKTYDPANGFLEIRGDASLPGYQAAAFRHADGGWLLALQKRWPDSQQTWFMRSGAAGGAPWTDVSSAVMPDFDPQREYALPRRGLQVQGSASTASQRWSWTGRRFELQVVSK